MISYVASIVVYFGAYLTVGIFIFAVTSFLYGFRDKPSDALEFLESCGEFFVAAWPIALGILVIYPLGMLLFDLVRKIGKFSTFLGGRLKIAMKGSKLEVGDE